MSLFNKKSKEKVYTRYSSGGANVSVWKETVEKLQTPEGRPGVLDDIMVLDASAGNFSGIIAASFFAEFGAEVIKIEPAEGDPCRKMTPYGRNVKGVGIPFMMEARNKRYMTLDLENTPEDRETFAALAGKTAVVIETFPAGKMDSWGIGYRQLSETNPGLIYIAITPYGQYTKKAREFVNLPDADITTQTGSGLSSQIGDFQTEPEPYSWPLKAGMWMGWYVTGISAALGGTLALLHRQGTGEGQMIDVAGMDAYSSMTGFPASIGYTWDKPRPRIGVLDFILYPYSHWKCKDGLVAIAAPRDHDFRALLKILHRWDLEDDFKYTPDRIPDIIEQAMTLHREIEKETVKYTAEELTTKALTYAFKAARSKWRGGGVPIVMGVMTPEQTIKNRQWQVRKSFKEVEDESVGKFVVTSGFVKMSESPPQIKWVSCDIGKDDEYIKTKYLQDA